MHEADAFATPVGHPQPEHTAVEIDRLLHVDGEGEDVGHPIGPHERRGGTIGRTGDAGRARRIVESGLAVRGGLDGMIAATERARVFLYTTAPAVICDYSVYGRQYRTDAIPLDGVHASYFQPGKIMALRYDPADPSVVVAGARTSCANIWIAVAVLCVPFLIVLRT
jgi:hypothetical protein